MIGEADMDRRDGAARMASASGTDRFSDAVFSTSAIDHLRADVENLRSSLAAAASPEVLRDVDRAMGVLSRQVRDARTEARQAEQVGSALAESVADRLDDLRDSIESLRAAEPTVALAAAVETMARKLEIIDAKAIDPVAVARLQLQTAELKDLVGRTLAHAAAAAEQVRQEAAEQLAAVGAGALEAVTAASADFGRKAAETLTRIEDRLEQHLAAQAPAIPETDALAALRDRLDHLAHDVQALAPATDGRLAAQVERLLARIDQGGGIEASTLAPLVAVLERHLVTLTERMGDSQVRLQRLDGIELLLQRMTGDMQRMRQSLTEEIDEPAQIAIAPGVAADWPLEADAGPLDPAFATLDEAGELFRDMHVPPVAADVTPVAVAADSPDPVALDADDPCSDPFWEQVLGPAFLEAAAQSLPTDADRDAAPAAPAEVLMDADAPQPTLHAEPAAPVPPEWQRRDRAGLPSLPSAKRRPDGRSPEVAPAHRDDHAAPLAPELTGLTDVADFTPAPAQRTLAPPQAEPAMATGADDAAQHQPHWPAHDAVAVWVVPEARERAAEAPAAPRPRPVAPAVASERLTHEDRKPRQKPISARDAAALEAALTAAPAEDEAPRVRLDYVAAADRAEHREKGARVARKRRSERRIHTALRLSGVAAAILILGLVTVKLTAREGVAGIQALVSAPAATDGSGPAPVDKTLLTKLPPPVGPAALKTAALAGDADAACEVGIRYADGKGTDVDTAAAMKWLGFAAAHGSVPAAYKLGSLYEFSTRNVTEAKRLYQWAAERGNLRAMHSVGVLYSDGVDGKPDWINATNWFRKAAELGLRDSQYNLGVIYGRGLAGAVDRAESWKWFQLAAKQGDTDSARKRDDVANKADPGVVDRAKAAAAAFVPGPVIETANTVPVKPEWEVAAPADAAPRKSASRS